MQKILGKYEEPIYTALRIVAGVLFSFHGLQKIFGVLANQQPDVMSQAWIGGVIELGTGALLALGLFTSWAAFLASGTMAVAYIQFHWKGRFDENFWPIVNQGELAVIYCFLFLYLAARGGGRFSLDARR